MRLSGGLETGRCFGRAASTVSARLSVLFRSHVVSFVEFRTPAIAHAASSVLAAVDGVHPRFLRAMNFTEREALLNFRLAPSRHAGTLQSWR